MTGPTTRRRVAILGGGMAAMAAAWRLSAPEHRDRIESVTIYQRGGRLGGKGASSRGRNGRIEEHGLHVWLGYYDNAFRLVRECYEELDRPRTDPECPIRTWRDAFVPAPTIGLGTRGSRPEDPEAWTHWTATFTSNDQLPGEPLDRTVPLGPADLVTRAVRLLADFARSLETPRPSVRSPIPHLGTVLSASPHPPRRTTSDLAVLWRHAGDLVTAGALEASRLAVAALTTLSLAGGADALTASLAPIERWREQLRGTLDDDPGRLRTFELVDLVTTCLRGIAVDGLLVDPRGFRAIDGEEFRDWLSRHGAAPETFASPLVTGVYDLAFAYHEGDPDQPMFAAGTGLYMSALMYFGYRGSIFWKMQAGMGDVVFAPLLQALTDRGVLVERYSRVDELRVDESGRLAEVVIGRQVDPSTRPRDPLVRFGGLPCFPNLPEDHELERTHGRRDDVGQLCLRVGDDVDDVVFALPIGMVPEVCGPLLERDLRWRDMTRQLGTVATQAAQLWLREDECELGLEEPGVTLTGHVKPFDTMASMTHLLPREDWPDDDRPRSLWYLCSTMRLEDEPAGDDGVRAALVRHLDEHLADAAPGVRDLDGFRWDLLAGAGDAEGPDRVRSQFVIANTDPSERYTQSLPGSGRYRLRPDDSGVAGLTLAGDWTDCGLNVGCIEAAAISGLQAANAVLGDERWAGISGLWEPLDRT